MIRRIHRAGRGFAPGPGRERVARHFAWMAPLSGLLLVGFLAFAVTSERGRERLRAEIVAAVENSVQGTLEIRALRPGGGLSLSAQDVVLRAPDGAEALRASSLDVVLNPYALLRGRIELVLSVDGPAIDLTPDAEGRVALSRALAPDRAIVETTRPGPQFSILLLVRDGRIERGTPGGEAGSGLAIERVDFAVRLEATRSGTDVTLDGSATLVRPVSRTVVLHAGIATSPDGTTIHLLRAAAGGSRVTLKNAVWRGTAESLSATAILSLHPDDVAIFAPSIRPRSPILAEAAAGPIDGMLVGSATVRVEGAGSLSAAIRGDSISGLRGSIVALRIDPVAWGIASSPTRRIEALAGFARTPDGRIAAHLESARIALRPGARGGAASSPKGEILSIDALALVAVREPNGDLDVHLERLRARDANGRWRLEKPAHIAKRGELVTMSPILLHGPWNQRLAIEGQWPPSHRRPLVVVAGNFALHGLPASFSAAPMAGFVDGRLEMHDVPAKTRKPEGNASLRLRQASWGLNGPVDVVAKAVFENARVRMTLDGRDWRGQHIRLQADAPMSVPGSRDHARIAATLRGFRIGTMRDVSGVVKGGLDHGRTWITLGLRTPVQPLVRLSATTTLDWSELALTLGHLELQALASAGLIPETLEGRVTGIAVVVDGRLHADFAITGARAAQIRHLAIRAGAHATQREFGLSVVIRDDAGGDGAFGVTAVYPALASVAREKGASVRWRVRGALAGLTIGEASGQTSVPSALRRTPQIGGRVGGAIALDARGFTAPLGWLHAKTEGLEIRGQPFGRIAAAARTGKDGVAAWVGMRPVGGGHLAVVATLAGNPQNWVDEAQAWRTAPLFAALVAEDLALSPYAPFVERFKRLEGRLAGRGIVRGTIAEPVPRGRLSVKRGVVVTEETGRLHGIELIAEGSEKRVTIERLVAEGRRGRVTVHAEAIAGPENRWALDGDLVARDFEVRGERFAGTLQGDAKIGGQLKYPKLDAEITIASGRITLPKEGANPNLQPLSPHPDIVVVSSADEGIRLVRGEEEPPAALLATLRVKVPGNFWIRGEDVNIEIKGDVTARTGERRPRIEGEIEAIRGQAGVIGKKFVLDYARIGFTGGPPEQARLDVRALHQMEDLEQTRIFADVRGTIAEPEIQLSSDPPMPEDSVISLLVLGSADPRTRSPDQQEPSLAGQAVTFVGNYLTKQLRDEVQKVVPVDVFELEPGGAGSASEGRLRVGKYIAPGLFLSYAHAFGAAPDEGANALRLEYRFHRAWYLISEFTDGGRGEVDAVWTREF